MHLPWKSPSNPPAVPEAVERATSPAAPAPVDLEVELRPLRSALETCSSRLDLHDSDLEDIGERLDRLTVAIAEGIEHVDRAERRVRATVARARKELSDSGLESPGVEAEWDQLRERDGDGGENGGMQPMRGEVGGDPSRAVALGDSFPGAWTEGDLPSLMDS